MQTLDQFVIVNTGFKRDFDGAFGAQCVDVVQLYLRDCLNDPPLGGNAIDEYGEDSKHWLWVRNNPANAAQLPPRGSIMIWGPDASIGTGKYGHTAVVLNAYRDHFISFDQNWPIGSPCHQVRHDYRGIIGWGVPHALVAKPPVKPPVPLPLPPTVVVPPSPITTPTPIVIPSGKSGCLFPFWRNNG